MLRPIIFLHFPFSLPRTAWNAFHWSYCSENFGISVMNVLFKMKYNTNLAHRLQMHHNATNWDKAQKRSCIPGCTKIFTEWMNHLNRHRILLYTGDRGAKKLDTHKLIFLPRTSKIYKNVSKYTPPSKTHLLSSIDMATANNSREIAHTQAVNSSANELLRLNLLIDYIHRFQASVKQCHLHSTNSK